MSFIRVRLIEDSDRFEMDVFLSRVPCVGEDIDEPVLRETYRVVRVVHRILHEPSSEDYAGYIRVVEVPSILGSRPTVRRNGINVESVTA